MSYIPKSFHVYNSIGIIRTPYKDTAPYQPIKEEGEFVLVIDEKYSEALHLLHTFKYIYVLFHLHKQQVRPRSNIITPPWAPNLRIGTFASRSPARPNAIGLSVVKIIKIANNKVFIEGIDAFDGSPILDIKPYLDILDAKSDANFGWIDETGDETHLALHIKGIPHEH